MESKLPSESKMVWLGIIQIVVGLLGALPEVLAFVQNTPLDFTDATAFTVSLLTVVAGVATILLRFVTKQPITFKR